MDNPLRFRALTVWRSVLPAVVAAGLAWPVSANDPEGKGPDSKQAISATDLFAMPARRGELLAIERVLRNGAYERAEVLVRQRLRDLGRSADHYYLLAAALAGQKRTGSALKSLETAVSLGLSPASAGRLEAHFSVLSADPRYLSLVGQIGGAAAQGTVVPPEATPSAISNRTALVSASNTLWDPDQGSLRSYFRFDPAGTGRKVQTMNDRPAERLNQLFAAGRAAGNHGDLYDNRDDDHSTLKRAAMPQLVFVEYDSQARAAKIQVGVNPGLLFNAITFGNSSMAVTGGPFWRSQPRLALTRPGGAERFYREYAGNHLYVFPEHRDYDPGHGDVIPANTPYMLISEGSSGSDKPLMRAVASILAAFRPEVKDFLKRTNLVMPTVQMIFRRGQNSISSDGAYLSGVAHPTVFNGKQINLLQMIGRANQLNSEDVPPMVRLSVLQESAVRPGIDCFGPETEQLSDTPSAIGRVIRSTGYHHRMRVSTAGTVDPNGRKLTFHWVVLRGDAQRIGIEPQDDDASIVDLTVPWHERKDVPGRPGLFSNRVDIGVFVHNGVHYSAPAFISFYYPANQWREYDADRRIRFLDYHASKYGTRYADPALFPLRDWSDRYEYDRHGRLIGWTRERAGGKSRFSRHGGRVIETDSLGRPLRTAAVRYDLKAGIGGLRHVVEQSTGRIFNYSYADDDDFIGNLVESEQPDTR